MIHAPKKGPASLLEAMHRPLGTGPTPMSREQEPSLEGRHVHAGTSLSLKVPVSLRVLWDWGLKEGLPRHWGKRWEAAAS